MKNTVEEYILFEHKNLEYINGTLNLARQNRQAGKLEGLMAATVIYTNLVEYLTSNLSENLEQMVFLSSYRSFQGVFFVKSKEKNKTRSPQTLGQLHNLLEGYEFPDSTDFLALVHKFAETRNAIFHRLLKVSQEELQKGVVDQQFSTLHGLAEEILDKYNTITKGITNTWYSVAKSQFTKQESQTVEELQAQISALLGQVSVLQAQLVSQQSDGNSNK